jgi:aminopeptidase N
MKAILLWGLSALLVLCFAAQAVPQSGTPRIDIEHYDLEATLIPDSHEISVAATVTFKPLQETDVVVFRISENVSVFKVSDTEDIELEFGQDEIGPGILSVRFRDPLSTATAATIKVEYEGGFDRDRYSRYYMRDESSAYIGMEGSFLLYHANWFPTNDLFVDRATATVKLTAPLGIIAIGPGKQLPVETKGVTETFGWSVDIPFLPNTIVAGEYYERSLQVGDLKLDCFAREDHLDAIQAKAEEIGEIILYYSEQFGPSAAGDTYRIVEVDDRLQVHHGTLGTIFITHSELSREKTDKRELARRVAYQWWMETIGLEGREDLWLVDGLSYYSAALYLGQTSREAFDDELQKLAVLGLKFESKSPVAEGIMLGYRTEPYESVVAGKGAWVHNMLRTIIGTQGYSQLLRQYVQEYGGKAGSTRAFKELAEGIYGNELDWFFAEWINTTGVPLFDVDYLVYRTRDGFRVSGSVKQDRDLFRMPVEITVETSDDKATGTIDLSGKTTPFDIETFSMPLKVLVDPENKILRDSEELRISVQLSLGDDLKEKENFIEAIRAYEKALRMNPRKSIAHFSLAEVFYEQFNLQAAANSFRDALNGDRQPPWIEVWCYVYLGKIYDILGQRQRAMAEYNKAINTNDDTNGAQEEAKKWLAEPFTRARTTMDITEPPN